MTLQDYIRDVKDFPIEGIIFKDITPLLQDKNAFKSSIKQFAEIVEKFDVDVIVGIESRGFIFGCALANELNLGFVPIRKPGKLPSDIFHETYKLEYGTDRLEIHKDALNSDNKVLLIDDLLATGGTAEASINLINKTGATISLFTTLIELSFLNGKKRLNNIPFESLITY